MSKNRPVNSSFGSFNNLFISYLKSKKKSTIWERDWTFNTPKDSNFSDYIAFFFSSFYSAQGSYCFHQNYSKRNIFFSIGHFCVISFALLFFFTPSLISPRHYRVTLFSSGLDFLLKIKKKVNPVAHRRSITL